MRIALFEPDIAGNVGTLIRLASCWGIGIDLIEPMGFPWSSRALIRAGMDYAAVANVARHADFAAFRRATSGRLVLSTTQGATALPQARFLRDDVVLLGSEASGVPAAVHATADLRVRVPMREGARSLNVAVAAAVVVGEAMRQTGWPALA